MINDPKPYRIASHDWRWLFTFVFALIVIWTGLLRCIEAQEFKPNAFYFCGVTGVMAIAAGFLYWMRKPKLAMIFGLAAAGFVLGYYLFTFTTEPKNDANYRVGVAIVAAIAELIVVLLPPRPE
jgi:MFS family permease